MKKDCVACYVADEGFLFPSISSAISLRQAYDGPDLDIIILVIGGQEEVLAPLRARLADFAIAIMAFDPDFAMIDLDQWNSTHVPLAALGRFFLPAEILSRYRRLIYIDGDTMLRGNPRALVQFDPGAGMIGAVEDVRSFARRDRIGASGPATRQYFSGIGVSPDQDYFNSGLFVARAADWPAMARDCLAYIVGNTRACLFHDQSAMNAVLGGANRVRLSLRWNFQTPYHLLGQFGPIDPVLVHFTEAGKPWLGALRPWADWHPRYAEIERLLPPVPRRAPWPEAQVAGANRHYADRVFRQTVLFGHRLPGRWRAIRRYEARCAI